MWLIQFIKKARSEFTTDFGLEDELLYHPAEITM